MDEHKSTKLLRGTSVSRATTVGGNELEVAQAMGHETTEMARVYVKVASERSRALAERVGSRGSRKGRHKERLSEVAEVAGAGKP